ncbi:type I polyketide synthase [Micromonospora carbonacea]|uniref:SDR family NAD(P)-dependent oxidoreductase n=1 Tax=Micromonospora carbonacea TaxID=47853 RepID=A0A7H8XM27_9ACTN|nr:type I polyketide synthase [Micromonospora carbonacea]MBB5826565.1 enediyne polyketide synthase [Micromonospora carbonacea]QLD26067.1 SDR family NAD(P)-dependent oxidoreductase [Micromonospora carbonacea]
MSDRIAVVGIACRYPDAEDPNQLWENVLTGRRAFRRLPDERMNAEDYYSPDPAAPDRFYSAKAAVIEGFEFDRVKHRIAGSTFRSTDMTHWLALDTVARALADAGFADGEGLPLATTGVVIGNTLTGEFSRANLLRLRWPYVRRTVGAALREQGWDDAAVGSFLDELEPRYKAPFPPIDEDTLAGGLANTIAGRVCNHFDFKGGGYTVDGACSSSLLSVATACNALARGDLDAAVAGGVDLSIDPFEVIGFAKTGALATGEMRVYDRNSNGFWPGEGCGMLVLMRDEDAVARGLRRHAVIAGWGYSSDGKGGITRPEASGHRLAIRRAYERAGFGIDSVSYLEGHGTGTAVGDATELTAFTEARREADATAAPAAISTVKGNFGHTKAAAGVAGLLKAILAVRQQVIPPATGHVDPHPVLDVEQPALRVPATAELWPADKPIRAAVSSMGFGGINAHVVLESAESGRRTRIGTSTTALVRSRQDTELLMFDARTPQELGSRLSDLAPWVGRLSYAELGDLAVTLAGKLAGRPVRAAVVVASPEQARQRLERLVELVDAGEQRVIDAAGGVFLGAAGPAPRIGFLFPGQGAGRRADGGALRRRFEEIDALYQAHQPPPGADLVATAVAQPRIVTASVAGLRALSMLGIRATGAAGHSLGELTALHWAGAMDEQTLIATAGARGRIMADASAGDGTMASISAAPEVVEPLLAGTPVVIAGYNSPEQTVVSGPVDAVLRVGAAAERAGLFWTRIAVSHAFHSEAVAPAAVAFAEHLSGERFAPLAQPMVSTVTGDVLPADTDVPELLRRQVLDPVRFTQAVRRLADDADLLLEVGPGRVLRGLAADIAPEVPTVSLETDSLSLAGLLNAVGAAYAAGAAVNHEALFQDRFARPLEPGRPLRFFASPAESAPAGDFAVARTAKELAAVAAAPDGASVAVSGPGATLDSLELLRRLAAERAELPLEAVRPDSRPLDELHLSSITVGQIVNQAARELNVAAPTLTSSYATATVAEIAQILDDAAGGAAGGDEQTASIAGVAPWVRAFAVDLVPTEVGPRVGAPADGEWQAFTAGHNPLAEPLRTALHQARVGGGVLLCLPRDGQPEHIPVLLRAARAALAQGGAARFVTVGDRRTAAGLAKTLHQEHPEIVTTVVTLPLVDEPTEEAVAAAVTRVVADVAATAGFSEVHYDADGNRHVPVLRPAALPPNGGPGLGVEDVLLVTGGGKGITAECALALGRDTLAAVGLIGRSDPATDAELAANLDRLTAAGVRFHYARADITALDEVKAAVNDIERVLGPVTGVLHGAGRNEPTAVANLDEATFRRTLAPKIDGLEAVLAATDPHTLRLLVTFGSIIGRAGLRGEGHYATANDWMTDLTRKVGEDYPHIRCLALEWSVWSGAGMGERLGVLEALTRDGIAPIPVEAGIATLKEVLASPAAPQALVVMGRADGLATVTLERRELPLLRFVDRPQVHYPGVELVVDADLTADDDLYLADHLLDGDLLFPAVLGMEAMAQAASALTGRTEAPVLEDVELLRPIVVPPTGSNTIRIAVLAAADGTVEAVVRSSDTNFAADHFRARLRWDRPLRVEARPGTAAAGLLPIDPARDLYGPVLFQGRRFQRLLGYLDLAAKSCTARVSNRPVDAWFARYRPGDLVLGDPGTRDTVMHALQCCVPDATLLPGAIERLHLADPKVAATLDTVTIHAVERLRQGDTYHYDVDVCDADGNLVERWQGLRLHAVRKQDGTGPWLPALVGPYLERRVGAFLPDELRVVVRPDDSDAAGTQARRRQTARAVSWALGTETTVRYRPDGRPEVDGDVRISASHAAGVTVAVAGVSAAVGCDVELAAARSADEWAGLIGADGLALATLLAREQGEDLSVAATRVWGAVECLRKNGHARVDLVAEPNGTAGWVALRSGAARIATFVTTLNDVADPVVFTMLAEGSR